MYFYIKINKKAQHFKNNLSYIKLIILINQINNNLKKEGQQVKNRNPNH